MAPENKKQQIIVRTVPLTDKEIALELLKLSFEAASKRYTFKEGEDIGFLYNRFHKIVSTMTLDHPSPVPEKEEK